LGIVNGHLVILSSFGILYQENLAALRVGRKPK
jgi:hypothetical protein